MQRPDQRAAPPPHMNNGMNPMNNGMNSELNGAMAGMHIGQKPAYPGPPQPGGMNQRPGMPPSQYAQRPGMHPQQPPPPGMQPGMQRPGMAPPGIHPGMQRPGMPNQPGMQRPGMLTPNQPGMQRPGMPMQPQHQPHQPMQPGMQRPNMPPQPGMQHPGMPPQPGMQRPGIPGMQPPPPGGRPVSAPHPQGPPQTGQPPQTTARGVAPPMRSGPPEPPGYAGARPNARPMMRPMPPGAQAQNGMRPVPPGSQPQNGAAQPPQNGGGYPPGQQPAPSPQQAGARAAPAQLPSSAMPRPCATERKCGAPRAFFHRGMVSNLDANASVSLPGANADTIGVDDGSAPLRFMRLTTNALASDPSVMAKSGVPLAVVLSPFADPAPGESPVPVVDFSAKDSSGGPLRCDKCHTYANPGFKFLSGGAQFQCNVCRAVCQTPSAHYSPISPANGLRMDADTRHELRFGSVEYIVGSADYRVRDPKPAAYVYAVDVSAPALASGLAASAFLSIKSALAAGLLPGGEQGARVAIFTFDDTLHFYDARSVDEGGSVTMHVVPDVLDPFLPLGGDGFLQTPTQAIASIEAIVEIHGLDAASAQRRQQQQDTPSASSALGSALQAILLGLSDLGGKAFVISASIPNAGMAKLERRGGGAVGGGEDREMALLRPAIPDYEVVGCDMAERQISVDLFLAPASAYIDAATLARVPRASGGRLFMFSEYDRVRDAASLHRAICKATSSVRAFEGIMRVRASVGVETVGEFIGHFARPQRGDDVAGPVFDSTTSTALELKVVSKLLEGDANPAVNRTYAGAASLFEDVCVQCAVLFTDPAGRRRIRVHTMFANKTTVLADVFRLADVDATAAFLAKKAASAVFSNGTPISKAKEALVEKTVQALFVYRKRCTSSSMSGQLILPEALKTLPVTILGLTKSAAFRSSANSMQAAEAVTVDDRIAALAFLVSALPGDIAVMGYPRLWDIGDLTEPAGRPLPLPEPAVVSAADPGGRDPAREPVAFPPTVALMSSTLADNKMLLAENGMRLVVWLGDKVDQSAANDVIAQISASGQLAIRAETAGSAALLDKASERAMRIKAIVERVVNERSFMAKPQVVVRSAAGVGGEAKYVMPMLIEDRAANGAYSYVEFLRHVHKKVMARVANESAQNEMQTWELLNHGY